MHPEVVAYFKGRSAPKGDAPCFPTLHPIPVSGRSGLSLQFGLIMERAKIDRKIPKASKSQSAAKGVRIQSPYSFHSLRHSFVSMMANGDVDAELRMKLSGHTTGDAHAIYTATEVETLRRAVEAIPSIGRDR